MLIKITNSCHAGCSHCMEDSTPAGKHMDPDTFERALDFTSRMETPAWLLGCPPIVILSGGECTEHPDVIEFIERVYERKWLPVLTSNGMWLHNKELRESILRPEWATLYVQITHDSRFYPSDPPPRIDDPRLIYIEKLNHLIPLGRIKKRMPSTLPSRRVPSSFNLRSLTRHFHSFQMAVITLRKRSSLGLTGNCSPSISNAGEVMAGETNSCFVVGTVDSTNAELTENTLQMECNRCHLEDNLSQEEKRAIGLSRLYGPNE